SVLAIARITSTRHPCCTRRMAEHRQTQPRRIASRRTARRYNKLLHLGRMFVRPFDCFNRLTPPPENRPYTSSLAALRIFAVSIRELALEPFHTTTAKTRKDANEIRHACLQEQRDRKLNAEVWIASERIKPRMSQMRQR